MLARDRSECSNGILENDPLNYMFEIDGEQYRETLHSLYIRPDNPRLYAYGRVKIRKRNIKELTPEKLLKRFEQIKAVCVENKNNFINLCFDLNEKLGLENETNG
jgi:hypothetical protein